MRVLVVEDDDDVAGLIADDLRRSGHTADVVASAGDGRYAASRSSYSVLVVDRGLPDEEGTELVRSLRRAGVSTPILMLTARGQVAERVAGLEAGADDYLVKPFALAELRARITALARRPPAMTAERIEVGNVVIDLSGREVLVAGRPLGLSRREFALLELLMQRFRHVMPKTMIEELLYGFDEALSSNTVEVHVHNLRRALARAGASLLIETRRGVGYRLTEAEATARPAT